MIRVNLSKKMYNRFESQIKCKMRLKDEKFVRATVGKNAVTSLENVTLSRTATNDIYDLITR